MPAVPRISVRKLLEVVRYGEKRRDWAVLSELSRRAGHTHRFELYYEKLLRRSMPSSL
jgi:hypothetical protein